MGPIPMRRRTLLLAAVGLCAAPHARAQKMRYRLAWLSLGTKEGGAEFLNGFLEGLAALDYVEGRNFVLDSRWGENSRETLDRLSLEAASLKPAVIIAHGPAVHSARKIPGTIPVVMGFSGDPVEAGIAQSYARPGGRFTGVTFLAYDLVGKRVELLHEVLPKMKRLAVLSRPEHPGDAKELAATRAAAKAYHLDVVHHPANNQTELERALSSIASQRADAVVILPDALMVQERDALARFSIENRIPAISGWASIAEGGVLMTYGPNLKERFRRLGYFVDRILRGASGSELPIEQPTKLELVLNLKTARMLGLTVPQTVMVRADRLIQ